MTISAVDPGNSPMTLPMESLSTPQSGGRQHFLHVGRSCRLRLMKERCGNFSDADLLFRGRRHFAAEKIENASDARIFRRLRRGGFSCEVLDEGSQRNSNREK